MPAAFCGNFKPRKCVESRSPPRRPIEKLKANDLLMQADSPEVQLKPKVEAASPPLVLWG